MKTYSTKTEPKARKAIWFTGSQKVALGVGVVAMASALTILWADPVTTGVWTIKHGLFPGVLFLATALGLLATVAWVRGSKMTSVGFTVIALMTTTYVLINSVGNQVERNEAKTSLIRKANDHRAELKAGRQTKLDEIASAEVEYRDQMSGNSDKDISKCAVPPTHSKFQKRCPAASWAKRLVEDRRAGLKIIDAELATLPIERSVNPKAEHWGKIGAVFGANPQKIEKLIILGEAPLLAMIFEMTLIMVFHYAFGTLAHSALPAPTPTKLKQRKTKPKGPFTRDEALADLMQSLADGKHHDLEALKKRWGWEAVSRVSRLVTEAEANGHLRKERNGRNLVLHML